jgi:hypothetical protein
MDKLTQGNLLNRETCVAEMVRLEGGTSVGSIT